MTMRNSFALGTQNGIIKVANAALSHPRPIRTWFGESDLQTPLHIVEAAEQALRAGNTFYAPRRGVLELRQAISDYLHFLYGTLIDIERVTVTSSGMNAIMIALQSVLGIDGGNIVVVSPIWPNISNAIAALGGECRHVRLSESDASWFLELEQVFSACDEDTRAIFVATPGNPTGWICDSATQICLLNFCREKDIYLIADEVYQRLAYDQAPAASFLQVPNEESHLIVVNSFSKTWAMSGWRLGWLVHPRETADCIGELNAVNNTGASTFVQLAGVSAIRDGEPFVAKLLGHCLRGRKLAVDSLRSINSVRLIPPQGGMYAFFSLDGVTNSLNFALQLAKKTGIGLAPGCAFGPGNDGWFRLCYALEPSVLTEALSHLEAFIIDQRKTKAV